MDAQLPSLSPDQARAFRLDRKGAVIGAQLAERFHWKIGDTITLRINRKANLT